MSKLKAGDDILGAGASAGRGAGSSAGRGAARSAVDAATAAAERAARSAKEMAQNAAKMAARNQKALLAAGVAAGGLYYLDQQYADASEDIKDCMKICLPENWDEHAYGDLEKTELKYKEIADAGDQPVCTENIPDCGKYCGDKCNDLHEYDAPGSGLVEGVAGDVGETAGGIVGGLTGGLFGGLGQGLGVDGTTMMIASASSSFVMMMLVIFMVMR